MPNRFIKESIGTSETLALLTGDEERHFWRLVVQADDFGRFDARPHVIRARAYAAMLKQVDEVESERRTLALEAVGLIHLYVVESRPYGFITTWEKHQQARAKVSKFPPMLTDDSARYQPISRDITPPQTISYAPESESESENVNESAHRSPERASPFVLPEWIQQETWDDFLEMRAKQRASPTPRAKLLIISELAKFLQGGDDPNEVLRRSTMNNWKGVFPLKDRERSNNGASKPGQRTERAGARFDNSDEKFRELAKHDIGRVSQREINRPPG